MELPILLHMTNEESHQVGGRISIVLVMWEVEIIMFQEIQSVKWGQGVSMWKLDLEEITQIKIRKKGAKAVGSWNYIPSTYL